MYSLCKLPIYTHSVGTDNTGKKNISDNNNSGQRAARSLCRHRCQPHWRIILQTGTVWGLSDRVRLFILFVDVVTLGH